MSSFLKRLDILLFLFSTPITDAFFCLIASGRGIHTIDNSRRLPVRFVPWTILEHECLLMYKRFLQECDGVLMPSSHSYEHASLIQMEECLKSLPPGPLPLYVIGPLLPPGYGRPSASEQSQDVQVFLKEMQTNYGERSVVYVGFFLTIGRMPQIFIIIFSDLFWVGLLAYDPRIHR